MSENPADFTPNVLPTSQVTAPTVLALAQSRGVMYAGGHFRAVENASGTRTVARDNIVAFDSETGKFTKFAPQVRGQIWAVQPYKGSIFLGGTFKRVDGINRYGVVRVDSRSGEVIRKFKSPFSSGQVTQLRMARGKLIAGGSFPGALRALNPRTGAVTKYMRLRVKGSVADNAGFTRVTRFAVNPQRTRLVAVGNFTSVAGKPRWRAVMINLAPRKARLNPWSYSHFKDKCADRKVPAYLRDVDFSPNGSYFVVVASGFIPRTGGLGTDVCDAAARFETGEKRPDTPTWINYTGGDSLYSTTITGAAVYVQGHQRWLDNPLGVNSAGAGAVERKGIGAIDPDTGEALPWNPSKTRGIGGKDLLATRAGLWVGSDGTEFNGEFRARIAFCPI